MFFDTLAGIVERHLPEFVPMMAKARIFRMESRRKQTLTAAEAIAKWEPDERTIENFRLPFGILAIEEADARNAGAKNCVVFSVIDEATRRYVFLVGDGNAEPTVIGAGELTALPDVEQQINTDKYGRILDVTRLRLWEGGKKQGLRQLPNMVSSLSDKVKAEIAPGEKLFHCGPACVTIDGKRMTLEELKGDEELLARMRKQFLEYRDDLQGIVTYTACASAVLSVLIINEPASFIVEERPLAPPRECPTTIRRSADRSHFIVLKPRQIRERFLWPEGHKVDEEEVEDEENKRRVTPHERRGHFRRLQSERFKAARGQVIWIKPMWVGPEEAVKAGNRYKVRLDL